MYCKNCGQQIADQAVICVHCGVATGVPTPVAIPASFPKSRVAYVLLGIFLGGLGIHNFYAGYVGRAIAQLLITLFIGWLIVPLIIVFIWVIIEVIAMTHDARGVRMT